MKILIDADGCPVVDTTVRMAREYNIPCIILCDTAHQIQRPGATTRILSKGSDSVDFALVNMVEKGDLVITQDYGLAAMCIARGAQVLHQDGRPYTSENIDGLLFSRHASKKARQAGLRVKGPKKRSKDQDRYFETSLRNILERNSFENTEG
ncbi:YaiI/YqxD family protein [Alkalibacter rhizosphaerae]|uniref:UPF0178 protein J0B03_08570 n=1 Tax=Alkalibacter rhizosphaerae TaxID=2815577 RepID=A0A974XGG5_9FIRM|nr:YaiI/YqxD family protein [Alkalibacter rhizosphaerae]QSX07863.1 YaiI/YqxD family protein [Alkalibacter rhizosphaerae]